MKVTAISDTHMYHAKLTAQIKELRPDVLIHCGDMTDAGTFEEIGIVADWLRMLKAKEYVGDVVVIAGNHDRSLQSPSPALEAKFQGLHYLRDSAVTLHGFKFYGSPWTHGLDDWGFQYTHRHGPGPEVWQSIPEDTDILVTHGPPQGIRAYEWGCPYLLERVQFVCPRAHFFGHVHDGYGITSSSDTLFVNASSWTSRARIMNAPISVDFE